MGFEQETASIDKVMGTDWRKFCGFIKKNDAFNEVYLKKDEDELSKYFDVINKKRELLGRIVYFKKWKKWTWQQCDDIVMDEVCLREVVDFLREIKNDSPDILIKSSPKTEK